MPVQSRRGHRPRSRRALAAAGVGSPQEGHLIRQENTLDLEETLAKVVELSREELHIVRKRAEEKTPARDHGHDFNEMRNAADRLDHYAHMLRRLHDNELGQNWRHESLADRA